IRLTDRLTGAPAPVYPLVLNYCVNFIKHEPFKLDMPSTDQKVTISPMQLPRKSTTDSNTSFDRMFTILQLHINTVTVTNFITNIFLRIPSGLESTIFFLYSKRAVSVLLMISLTSGVVIRQYPLIFLSSVVLPSRVLSLVDFTWLIHLSCGLSRVYGEVGVIADMIYMETIIASLPTRIIDTLLVYL
ncbi:hypothetical protein L9F63_026695, partial [Diploptera punctata]